MSVLAIMFSSAIGFVVIIAILAPAGIILMLKNTWFP